VLTSGSALVFDGVNLGVGTTPVAWTSAFKALQVGTIGSLAYNGSTDVYLSNNYANIGGTSKYITTAAVTLYQQGAGVHAWYNAASGTAGTNITFTQIWSMDTTGNLIPAVAAKGVNFTANTPASGMTSQLLNWYEEGNWTPTLTPGSGTITVSENAGYYTRVGRLVTFNCLLNVASVSSPTGAITLNGLPFTCKNTNAAYAACSVFAYGLIAGTSTQIMASVNKNATTIAVYGFAGSTGTYVNLASAVQAGAQFQIAGAYVV
jgi:hypothetical protein